MSDIRLNVGKRLSELRNSKRMRQAEVAEYLSISLNAYQNYEYGKREAGYSTLVKLAELFDVSLDYIFCRTDEMHPSAPISETLDTFSQKEKMLLHAYMGIDDRSKSALMSIVKEISDRYREQSERQLSDSEKESKFA